MKRLLTVILAAAMVLTMGVPFAFAEDSGTSQSSSKGPVLTDYSVEMTNTDPKTEEGEEIIVKLDFDKKIKTDKYTQNAFNITLNNRSLSAMGFGNPEVSVDKDDSTKLVLDIKGVKDSTWTYLVTRSLSISLRSNYYEDIMDENDNGVPADGWTDIFTYVPVFKGKAGIDDVFEKTNYVKGSAKDGVKESVTFKLIGDAKGRAMNMIQILSSDSIENGNTILTDNPTGSVAVHSHMFKTLTNGDYVQALANAFNPRDIKDKEGNVTGRSIPSKNYTMSFDSSEATVTITANDASDTQTLENAVIRQLAYNTKNDYIVQQTFFKQEIADAKARYETIKSEEYNKVGTDEKTALNQAITKAESAYASISDQTTAIEYNKMRNALRNAVTAAQDNEIATDQATRNGTVSLQLKGGAKWTNSITGVDIDGKAIDSTKYSIRNGYLNIDSLQFSEPERSKKYTVTIHSSGFADVTKEITVHFYGAQTFQMRYVDNEGQVIKSKTYTMDEMKALAEKDGDNYKDCYFHAICTMRGLTAFKAQGVRLETLLEDSGIDFKEGMSAKLRTNDSVKGEKNDPADENAYYWRGNFTYDYLMQDRYYFPDLYDKNSALYKTVSEKDGKVTFVKGDPIRKAAGASENKVRTSPMIAFNFAEQSWSEKNQDSLETTAYDNSKVTDNTFRFLFGTALDIEDGSLVSKAETTLWSVSYQTFGIDIVDPHLHTVNISDPAEGQGTITADKSSAKRGDKVTVSTKAGNGYSFAGLTVKDKEGNLINIKKNNDGTYTFIMPDESVTAAGSFTKISSGGAVTKPEPKYNVTVAETTGGTVTADKTSVKKGETITLTASPSDGYTFSGITVRDSQGNTISTNGKNGKYTFVMPSENVTVTGIFKEKEKEEPSSPMPFTDVSADRWSKSAIQYVYDNGLFNGISATEFSPETDMNRGMIAAVIYRLDGSPSVNSGSAFTDVSSDAYYADAVKWASDNGIANGVSKNTFDPDSSLTREQLATFLYRYAKYKKYDISGSADLSSYVDSGNVNGYSTAAVRWAVANGIINGTSATTLDPQGTATREQVAAMLMRFTQKFVSR